MPQRTYSHAQVAARLRSIPVGSFSYLLGRAHVRRITEQEWEIDWEPARMLLTAIDRLMGPADAGEPDEPFGDQPYRFPRPRYLREVCR